MQHLTRRQWGDGIGSPGEQEFQAILEAACSRLSAPDEEHKTNCSARRSASCSAQPARLERELAATASAASEAAGKAETDLARESEKLSAQQEAHQQAEARLTDSPETAPRRPGQCRPRPGITPRPCEQAASRRAASRHHRPRPLRAASRHRTAGAPGRSSRKTATRPRKNWRNSPRPSGSSTSGATAKSLTRSMHSQPTWNDGRTSIEQAASVLPGERLPHPCRTGRRPSPHTTSAPTPRRWPRRTARHATSYPKRSQLLTTRPAPS